MNTVDIGLPQLAMHSAYETSGVKDTGYLIEASKEFTAVISRQQAMVCLKLHKEVFAGSSGRTLCKFFRIWKKAYFEER